MTTLTCHGVSGHVWGNFHAAAAPSLLYCACKIFIDHRVSRVLLTDYTRELFREAIPYSEINRMAEIVFLPRWQKLFVAAKRWKIATGNQVPW